MKIILTEAEHQALLTKAEEYEALGESALPESKFPVFARLALSSIVRDAVSRNVDEDKIVVEIEGAAYRAFEEKLYGHNAPHLQAVKP